MKSTINILCILSLVAILAFEFMPDVVIPIVPIITESPLTAAFERSLSEDLGTIAEAVGVKSPVEIDKALEAAFLRAADEADRVLDESIQPLADDDYEGLREVLQENSEDLK